VSEQPDIVCAPVMRQVAALVTKTFDFVIPPGAGSAVSFGAHAGPDGKGMLALGIQSDAGEILIAAIPLCHLAAAQAAFEDAARQASTGEFEPIPQEYTRQ
jgi:hypothetical protein